MSVLISVREASEKFSISKSTIIKWIAAGKIPALKVGKDYAYLVNPDDLRGKRPKYENLYSKLSKGEVQRISFEIRRFRLMLEMTQRDFGKMFGVCSDTISHAELGRAINPELYLGIWREKRKRGFE